MKTIDRIRIASLFERERAAFRLRHARSGRLANALSLTAMRETAAKLRPARTSGSTHSYIYIRSTGPS